MSATNHWYSFWNREGLRFLRFGKPHVPELEERVFHAFSEGYKQGWADSQLDFQLPPDAYIAAIEVEEVE